MVLLSCTRHPTLEEYKKYFPSIIALIKKGSDLQKVNNSGFQPIDGSSGSKLMATIVTFGRFEDLQFVLQYTGPGMNFTEALTLAVKTNKWDMVELLIQHINQHVDTRLLTWYDRTRLNCLAMASKLKGWWDNLYFTT